MLTVFHTCRLRNADVLGWGYINKRAKRLKLIISRYFHQSDLPDYMLLIAYMHTFSLRIVIEQN